VEQQREPPAAGKVYVYVAVPAQNMVAKIHSTSLQVRAIKVGQDPGALRAIPGKDVAVVLARGSATAAVLRSRADGGDDVSTLKTAVGLNQLALAPGGKHAVAYFDIKAAQGQLSKTSFQEVTVLHLQSGKDQSVSLSVGFRPSSVQFSSDGSRAFVVTEQAVSTIELAKAVKPAIVPSIATVKDPIQEGKLDEVLVTSDGKYALGRRAGLNGIRVVDLTTQAITDLDLGGDATDLDLTQDGKLAVATLRDSKQVAFIDIPGDLLDATRIDTLSTSKYQPGQSVLSADAKWAFLFTNATSQEVLMVADLTQRAIAYHPLKKGVRTVFSSPDGQSVLVVHNKVQGTANATDTFDAYVDKSYGYSLFKVATGFDKLVLTATDPGDVAFAPDSASAYLLLSDAAKGVRSVEAIDLGAFLVDSISLGSPPVALGVLATTRAVYVAQSHDLGRVTFVDMDSHGTKTVTGFELNSYVIE